VLCERAEQCSGGQQSARQSAAHSLPHTAGRSLLATARCALAAQMACEEAPLESFALERLAHSRDSPASWRAIESCPRNSPLASRRPLCAASGRAASAQKAPREQKDQLAPQRQLQPPTGCTSAAAAGDRRPAESWWLVAGGKLGACSFELGASRELGES